MTWRALETVLAAGTLDTLVTAVFVRRGSYRWSSSLRAKCLLCKVVVMLGWVWWVGARQTELN